MAGFVWGVVEVTEFPVFMQYVERWLRLSKPTPLMDVVVPEVGWAVPTASRAISLQSLLEAV